MKNTIRRLTAAAAVCALLLQSMPVSAMTDAKQLGYTKIYQTHESDEKLQAGVEYVFLDSNDRAMTYQASAFKTAKAVTDDDGTYYKAGSSTFLTWKIMPCTDNNAFTLRPAKDPAQYLAYQDGAFTLTDQPDDALILVGRKPEDSTATDFCFYSEANQAYLKWNGGKLTFSETACTLRKKTICAAHTVDFYYRDGSSTTPTLYQSIQIWDGDPLTLPELPEQDFASPVGWQQLDPANTANVLGEYPAGEAVKPAFASGTNAVFLAKYEKAAASLIPVGTGSQQSASVQVGKKVTVQLGAKDPTDYLLFDSHGQATALTAQTADDGSKSLTVNVTDVTMYLCAVDQIDEHACVRINSLYDLQQMRNLINSGAETADAVSEIAVSLRADIDLKSDTSAAWEPIGVFGKTDITFYGNGHTIRNLDSAESTSDLNFNGFFGDVHALSVSDLTLTGQLTGTNQYPSGGLVGNADTLTCRKILLDMEISGTAKAGGFAGNVNTAADLEQCGFTGSISGAAGSGLLFGYAAQASLSNCFVYGSASGLPEDDCLGAVQTTFRSPVYVPDSLDISKDSDLDAEKLVAASADAFSDGTVTAALNAGQTQNIWAQGKEHPVFAVGTYNLIVDYDKAGGALSVPKNTYQAGENVVFTANAGAGYILDLSAETLNGQKAVSIVQGEEENTWTFTMPADDTTLHIHFIKQEKPAFVPGDVDCSGEMDVSDAVLLARFLAEDSEAIIQPQGLRNADVNNSGQPDPEDTVLILKAIAQIITFRVES